MRISWDSHEKMTFSWEFSKSDENFSWGFSLMRISFFSWEAFFSHENWKSSRDFSWISWDSVSDSWGLRKELMRVLTSYFIGIWHFPSSPFFQPNTNYSSLLLAPSVFLPSFPISNTYPNGLDHNCWQNISVSYASTHFSERNTLKYDEESENDTVVYEKSVKKLIEVVQNRMALSVINYCQLVFLSYFF